MKRIILLLTMLPMFAFAQHKAEIRCSLNILYEDTINDYFKSHYSYLNGKNNGDTVFQKYYFKVFESVTVVPILDSLGHIVKFAHISTVEDNVGYGLRYDMPDDSATKEGTLIVPPDNAIHKQLKRDILKVLQQLNYRWAIIPQKHPCLNCNGKIYIGSPMTVSFFPHYPHIKFN